MKEKQILKDELPLFIPRSSTSTRPNKTGTWRYVRPFYQEKTAPCSAACPLGEDIPRIEMLLTQGQLQDAWEAISEENPFPSVCGRVCYHPCEKACNRGALDEPIAVRHLERFVGDMGISTGRTNAHQCQFTTGKRIAIAGAGPAGLGAAYFLTRLGYQCDVYEARSAPGGLLRWGIPAYRLPKEILVQEIRRIEDQGVTIHCNRLVTDDVLKELHATYDAFFVACGSERPLKMNIQGEELAHDGLRFLQQIQSGNRPSVTGTVAVVGGGNTAIDVARSLVRMGAAPVIVYRRRRQDMPAFEPEIEMALEEGIRLKELVAPIRIENQKGSPPGRAPGYVMTLQKMKVAATKIGASARVIADGNRAETLRVDHVFIAVGAGADALWQLSTANDPARLTLSHCQISLQDMPVIFGGDLTNTTKSVTAAIASGKQAAIAIDIYFKKGWSAIEQNLVRCHVGAGPALSMAAYLGSGRSQKIAQIVTYDHINTDYFLVASRLRPSMVSPEERRQSFAEIEANLSTSDAGAEAQRCFACGMCNACDVCRVFCPEVAVIVKDVQRFVDLDYCKGCGICVAECPRNAMALEKEKE